MRNSDDTADPSATDVGSLGSNPPSYRPSSLLETADATSAPPPKPMIARPVARPGRSGNHLMSVDTGEM